MTLAFAGLAVIGLLGTVGSLLLLQRTGAQPGLARRLAGPREVKVGRLRFGEAVSERPVRVVGRIRCADPLHLGDGERLVAFHRDVEVRVGGRWRSVERMRETRSFELWDHDGSLTIDPAAAAEPLITIPQAWRGRSDELQEPHASAVRRLAERHGEATEARAVTRTVNVTDRLLVLARAVRDERGEVRLEPPRGGYLISTLALPDAMRLLGGRARRAAAIGVVGVGIGGILLLVGIVGTALALLLG
jgi:hypothetical protein